MTVEELIEKLSECPPDYEVEDSLGPITRVDTYDDESVVEVN